MLKKSAIPEPSRRNSGHIATPAATACPPVRGQGRRITPSTVPGGTVLRIADAMQARCGGRGRAERCREVVHGSPHVGQVSAAAPRRRRADAYQRHVSPVEGLRARGRRVQGPGRHRLCHESVKPRLGHRARPLDLVDLGGIDVNAPHIWPLVAMQAAVTVPT